MIDYTSLFEIFGMFARCQAQFANIASRNLTITAGGETFRSLDRLRQEFVSVLNDGGAERDRLDAVNVLSDAARIASGWSEQLDLSLAEFVTSRVADELGLGGVGKDVVLAALGRKMLTDAKSLAANTVGVGAVTAGADNVGNAQCYASISTVDAGENVIDNERIANRSITVECVRDAVHHRVPEGSEEFRVTPQGLPPVAMRAVPVTFGDYEDSRNVVRDGAFELEAAGVFGHWSRVAGGGVFSRDTATKLFGGGSLKVTGDGLTAGDLQQDLVDRDPAIPSGRLYALGAWVYVSAYTAGQLDIDLLIDGVPSTLKLTVDGSTAAGQWLHLGGFEYLPRSVFPNKVKLRISCTAAFIGTVFVDGVSLAAATEVPAAGISLAVFQGATAPQALPVADRFDLTTTSDDASSFQTFFRDRLGVALPSSSTPTISDSLAE